MRKSKLFFIWSRNNLHSLLNKYVFDSNQSFFSICMYSQTKLRTFSWKNKSFLIYRRSSVTESVFKDSWRLKEIMWKKLRNNLSHVFHGDKTSTLVYFSFTFVLFWIKHFFLNVFVFNMLRAIGSRGVLNGAWWRCSLHRRSRRRFQTRYRNFFLIYFCIHLKTILML